MADTKRIAKNTLFLYIRMILILGVTLFTSRIVLQSLGISDYGIYSLVGGIVASLGFFNAAMSSATQRYLSFDIGKGDYAKLIKTFSATLTIHFGIAILILIIAETIGLWYINEKMIYPSNRTFAVNVIYQFSIFTFLLNVIQVPYNSLILAHEKMSVYAYVSIAETLLKLGIAYLLFVSQYDKLITYSILTFLIALIIRVIYQVYCRNSFPESKYKFYFERAYFLELISYSGWNLFGNLAAVARGQGINMVLNLFFGTTINAAYGITMQIQNAVQLFISNFQAAVNPQIIKTYAQENLDTTQKLILQSSKFSFLLLSLISLPIIYNIDFILSIWLVNIPEYTNIFIVIVIIVLLIDSLSGPLITGAQATGKIKTYQIVVGTLVFLNLPSGYLILKYFSEEPYSVFLIMILLSIFAMIFRLYFLKKVMNFSVIKFFKNVFLRITLVVIFSIISIELLNTVANFQTDISKFLKLFLTTIIVFAWVFLVGVSKSEKLFIKNKLISRL